MLTSGFAFMGQNQVFPMIVVKDIGTPIPISLQFWTFCKKYFSYYLLNYDGLTKIFEYARLINMTRKLPCLKL